LPIADCRLPIADCRLPIADCRLPIADCRLPIADNGVVRAKKGGFLAHCHVNKQLTSKKSYLSRLMYRIACGCS
jgi:hypothetical protein